MKKIASATDPLWYKDAIIYELHVRAYADSNNDGIGDFPGLLTKLDYLQDLGVTCIWLLPFFASPLRDDGYDISNYNDVNPSYGTLNDFKAFLDAAHLRGMQVMIEFVMNHTSDQHPWFKAARVAPSGSPERDMYVWSETGEKYKDARIIFADTETSHWTWDETAKAYYWHRFFSHQPDLNYDSPLVMEEVLNAMRFWLDMGVDALRIDAIPYLCERDGTSCENLPETHTVVKTLRAAIDADYANRMILAEANQWPADVRPYFGDGDECHMTFHFPLMPRIYMALRQEDRQPITDIMAQTPPIPNNCQWGLFLRNHDELTLEMVTHDERDYMYFAYSADPRMRINVGIRRRLAPLVDNNRRRIELLNSLLLSFPGTPILYYGDEIGMGDNIYLGDRNGVRTPMQWTSDRNAGFSKCDPAQLYFPVVMDPVYGYQVINVEAQQSDQSSLLHWIRNMIALRKLFQVFGRGTLTFLNPTNRKILAYLRELDQDDGSFETVLCVANLSRFAQPVTLDLSNFAGYQPVEMLGYVSFPEIRREPYPLTVAPYSFLWLELQAAGPAEGLNLEPATQIPESAVAEEPIAAPVVTTSCTEFLASADASILEPALRDWLPRKRWFGGKTALSAKGPLTELFRREMATANPIPGETSVAERATADFVVFVTAMPAEQFQGVLVNLENTFSAKDIIVATQNELPAEAATNLRIIPMPPSNSLWMLKPADFMGAAQSGLEHEAKAILILGPGADSLNSLALRNLADTVLTTSIDLAVPHYSLPPHAGLINSAILYPLTRAVFASSVRFPLSIDLGLSPRMAGRLVNAAQRIPENHSGEALLWPVNEAIVAGFTINEVDVGSRAMPQPSDPDINSILALVTGSLFADIEAKAALWQRPRRAPVVRRTATETALSNGTADVAGMVAAFQLATANLQEIWSLVLPPNSLLMLKRCSVFSAAEFRLPDNLWARIVFDFLIAYRLRTINRGHLLGALIPLYLAWVAGHINVTASGTPAESHIEAVAAAFEADKPYLVARWRWPDRFNS